MSIADVVSHRGITEVVHYTTSRGVLGTLDKRALLSRKQVQEEQRLEFILQLNTPFVKDPAWEDYVNLSITHINTSLFQISSGKWHKQLWWAVLSFRPIILEHDAVQFTTTNNIYPVVRRAPGEAGLEDMFAKQVPWGYYGSVITRGPDAKLNRTTDIQAEVLYPQQISTKFLSAIYVATDEHQDEVHSHLALVEHPEVNVVVDRGRFES